MFIQVIEGKTQDPDGVHKRLDIWQRGKTFDERWHGPRVLHARGPTTNKNGRRPPGHGDRLGGMERERERHADAHAEHAELSGRLAARNMLGLEEEEEEEEANANANANATWTPHWSGQIGALRYEAVGELSSAMDTVAVWEQAEHESPASPVASSALALAALSPPLSTRRGVVYYLQDTRVRGVLLWNLGAAHVDQALLAVKMPRDFDAHNQEALRRLIPFDPQPVLEPKKEEEAE